MEPTKSFSYKLHTAYNIRNVHRFERIEKCHLKHFLDVFIGHELKYESSYKC